MLRATRTFIEDLCAPEYAHNHLAVEISHPDGFTDAQELSIRVYSCEYRLLGCDTRSLKEKKSRKYGSTSSLKKNGKPDSTVSTSTATDARWDGHS